MQRIWHGGAGQYERAKMVDWMYMLGYTKIRNAD